MTEEDIKHLEDDSTPISDQERKEAAQYIRYLQQRLARSTQALVDQLEYK